MQKTHQRSASGASGNKTSQSALNRRQFLSRAAAAASAFMIVPRYVVARSGQTPPSEKVNVAGIGVAGQGGQDIRQLAGIGANIVALCDVNFATSRGIFRAYPDAKQYKDYRKMLDEMDKSIDAVVVGTPDNLHAVVSIAAMKRGKHCYCEKPLTHDVFEARKMTEVAQQYKVATQMGNQGQASEDTRRLCEYVWSGAIGPVREVHVWTDRPNNGIFGEYWPQGIARPTDTPPVPETLDWDLWLGPAPYRPYNPAYLPFKWRGWLDFGTGALGDIGCHACDSIFRALKLGHPISVEGTSTRVNDETHPLGSIVKYEFPARGDMPPVTLTWYDGGLRPMRPPELEAGRSIGDNGRLFIGDKGKILGTRIIPQSRHAEVTPPPQSIPRSPGHYQEFLIACKGGPPAGSNFAWAGHLSEVILLGNIALRRELREKIFTTKLMWDGEAMKVTNVPEANKFVQRTYRQGWSL
jgi:predicted dehydrogenase